MEQHILSPFSREWQCLKVVVIKQGVEHNAIRGKRQTTLPEERISICQPCAGQASPLVLGCRAGAWADPVEEAHSLWSVQTPGRGPRGARSDASERGLTGATGGRRLVTVDIAS